jgi:hypothetical protein
MKNLITSATDTRIKTSNAGVNDLVWLYRQKTIIFMHLVGMAIALLTPIEEISSGTFISHVVDGVLNVIPMGRNFSVRSTFPELVRLQAAVMTFFIPIVISIYFKCPEFKNSQMRIFMIVKNSRSKLIFLHFYLIFIPIYFIADVFFAEGTEFAIAPFLSGKFFLGAFGPIIFGMFPAITVCLFFMIFLVLIKFWRGLILRR